MIRLPGDGMSGGDDFSVKPDVLRELAGKSDTVGEEMAGDASFTADSSGAASAGHEGWRIAAALSRAQSVWEQNMSDFGEQVTDVAVRLRASANTYHESDQRSANGFRVD